MRLAACGVVAIQSAFHPAHVYVIAGCRDGWIEYPGLAAGRWLGAVHRSRRRRIGLRHTAVIQGRRVRVRVDQRVVSAHSYKDKGVTVLVISQAVGGEVSR